MLKEKLLKRKKLIAASLLLLIILIAAVVRLSTQEEAEPYAVADGSTASPTLVSQIQQCSRLYTAEYKVHKIITHSDTMKLHGKAMGRDISLSLPGGKRKVAIPVDATLKAYIDFSSFGEENVIHDGEKIEIILPQPHVMLTSTTIDHAGVKQYVAALRSSFSDEELASYQKKGRDAIISDIPSLGILDTARRSAAQQLIPIITRMGYRMEDVTITFIDNDKEKGGLTWFLD